MWVTYVEHKSLCKYTRMDTGQQRVEVKNMINMVLVKEDILDYVQDLKAVRGMDVDCAFWEI